MQWAVTDASQQQEEAYGDLKRKFEIYVCQIISMNLQKKQKGKSLFFYERFAFEKYIYIYCLQQSRVKQAVGVLKPQLNSETASSAVAAIEELEALASIDINLPSREEAQSALIQN